MPGTRTDVTVVNVVDGDTIKVTTPNGNENVRILSLDTEESRSGGSKPETPFGHEAKAEAENIFSPGDTVTLEFPGNEPLDVCWRIHRGSFDRPLVFVYLADGTDFQEHMIRQGFSPYFVKYGYAVFEENNQRYSEAEKQAQIERLGVWDPTINGGVEFRNYAALSVWWGMRAHIVEHYREFRASNPGEVLDWRVDYDDVVQLAQTDQEGRTLVDFRDLVTVGGRHGLVRVGSQDRPFDVFIRGIDDGEGHRIVNLLTTRYLSGDESHPRKGYAYLQGQFSEFRGRPQITVASVNDVSDVP